MTSLRLIVMIHSAIKDINHALAEEKGKRKCSSMYKTAVQKRQETVEYHAFWIKRYLEQNK